VLASTHSPSSVTTTYEEPHLLPARLLVCHEIAEGADAIEHEQRAQAHGCVEFRPREALERVDDDEVCRPARVDACDAHHAGDLAGADADCCARHERRDGDQGDQLDDAAESDEADEEQDGAGDDCQSSGDVGGLEFRMRFLHFDDDVADDGRHDGHGADGDVLGCGEGPVQNETDKTRVEAVLWRQLRQQCVGHTLGDDDKPNRDTWA
jgi:hypothetical protein